MKPSDLTLLQWIGIVILLNSTLIGGSTQLTDLFGPQTVKYVVAVCMLGNGFLGGLVSMFGGIGTQAKNVVEAGGSVQVSAFATKPLATAAMDPSASKIDPAPGASAALAKTVASALLIAFALSFLLAGSPAMAQAQRAKPSQSGPVFTGDLGSDIKNKFQGDPNDPAAGVKLTGDLKKDAMAIWTKIQAASKEDLTYASLMAGAAATPSSKVRKQCWDAIIAVNAQTNGEGLKNADGTDAKKPDPSMFTDIETIAEIMDSLSPQGPLFTSCSGAAELAKANVIQFISAAVTGAVGLAKLSPIPGL